VGRQERTLVSLGEIKELAQVGRPTVSNWRRRFAKAVLESAGDGRPPFPEPVDGTDGKPLFDAEEVASWLDLRPVPGAEPEDDGAPPTYGGRFRRALRLRGLVALRHTAESAEQLIVDALAVCAALGTGADDGSRLPSELRENIENIDPRLESAVRELVTALGSPGAAAEAVLGLAERLESVLVMDTTPPQLSRFISEYVGSGKTASALSAVIDLCAGTGDLLFALPVPRGEGRISAVEPDPLRRSILRYRLLASSRPKTDVLSRVEELDTTLPRADIVVANPPYVSGEHERDTDGPLRWALEAVRRLNPGGRGYVVVPAWTLTRQRTAVPTPAVSMREELLREGAVSAIVQLPRRLHPFRTGAEHVLLVLRGTAARTDEVLLVDADRIARRIGADWPRHLAALLDGGEPPVAEEAGGFPVSKDVGPRAETLLDGRSVLPAHRLASAQEGVDHFEETLDARRAVSVALPHLKEWVGDLGVGRRRGRVPHRKVNEYLRAGQLRLLPGHRIREEDLGDAGLMVVGRAEMLGVLPFGQRRIALENLARYPKATTTERGDVLLLTEHGVHTRVDDAGGCVLLAPVQALRITAYRRFLAEPDGPSPWMLPYPLAALLSAPRNQHRGSGSLVRRASVRDMDLPYLPPEEIAELEAILRETERHRTEVRRQLDVLETLARRLAAGVADGDLALRRRPAGW